MTIDRLSIGKRLSPIGATSPSDTMPPSSSIRASRQLRPIWNRSCYKKLLHIDQSIAALS